MTSRRNDPYLEDGGPGAEVVVSPSASTGEKSHLHADASGISAPPIPVPATLPDEGSLEHERDKADSAHEAAGVGPGAADVEMVDGRPKDVYDRFTKAQKTRIVAIVSYSAFISPVTSSVFLPSIPQMSEDLHTTPSVINYTVAVFIVVIGVAPLLWSPLSAFYGRRPIYLASMPIMVVASIGVAESRTVAQVIGTRILQGIGSSSVLSVGAGTIGDVFRPTERANAIGWFYTGALLGPALSPLIAGVFTQYTPLSWRSTQYFLVGCAALSVFLTFCFLPETHHDPIPHKEACQERGKRFVPYIFNPLSILGLFRWPNICAVSFISSCAMCETYCVLVPLSAVFQDQYNIKNVALAGLLYLANGGGNIIGSRIAGPYADKTMKRYIAKRGYRRPEDRLRAAVLGLGVLLPCSCLAYGWLLQYQAGGLAPPLICLVLNGLSLMIILTPLNTYAVDVMQTRSAEVIAVNNFIRYLFAAAASAFVLPMAHSIGWGGTMTFAAGLTWAAFITLLLVIRYGESWRETANKRYGYNIQSDDEKHGADTSSAGTTIASGKKDEEADLASPRTSRHSSHHDHHDHHDEHHDTPAELPALMAPKAVKPARMTGGAGTTPVSPDGAPMTRTSTRTSLPDVETVLKRTISLSGASVHGGG